MLAAELIAFGKPADVLKVVDLPLPEPTKGQLLLEMLAAPINPADLNVIEGTYGDLPPLPAIIGAEGVGRVAHVGPGVSNFSVGDLVLPLPRGAWTQSLIVEAADVCHLPAGVDPFQASMLKINPPTALGMLENFVQLQPGEWVVQNAANSAVGRCVIQIARAHGWKTLNVVRRPELIDELTAIGADVVVTEDCDLRKEIGNLCGGARPRLALNAVGGASALNIANALADGGSHVTYGAMSRQSLKIPNGLVIFRRISFHGFWVNHWHQTLTKMSIDRIFNTLGHLLLEGKLQVPVHRIYPLAEIHAALEEAARESRGGKVLLDLA